eukprot:Trichotokara_eunicae@DN4519_c0_g1_i1.p1
MTRAYTPNIFTKMVNGEAPSHKIFETEHSIAVLDAFPVTNGHSLLIPKVQAETLLDMTDDEAAAALRDLPRLCRIVKKATGASGVNVAQNNYPAAGQVVPHVHFHVVPRTNADHLIKHPPSSKEIISAEHAKEMLEKMKKAEDSSS